MIETIKNPATKNPNVNIRGTNKAAIFEFEFGSLVCQ